MSIDHSNSSSSKISRSGRNVIVVPVSFLLSVLPAAIRSVVGSPRANSWRVIFPSRRTSTLSHSDSAFTTETPTPCSPPETL